MKNTRADQLAAIREWADKKQLGKNIVTHPDDQLTIRITKGKHQWTMEIYEDDWKQTGLDAASLSALVESEVDHLCFNHKRRKTIKGRRY